MVLSMPFLTKAVSLVPSGCIVHGLESVTVPKKSQWHSHASMETTGIARVAGAFQGC